MAGKVANIKVYSPLKLHHGLLAALREAPSGRLTGKYHAICHYSFNLPLPAMLKETLPTMKFC